MLGGWLLQSNGDSMDPIRWKMLGGAGSVAHIWPLIGVMGISIPSISPTGLDQAPTANARVLALNSPWLDMTCQEPSCC